MICRVIPPRLRTSWCNSSFCKHRDKFMFALQHKICSTVQCATKLINARTSTLIWVTLYTAEFTQGASKSVSDTRCMLWNAGYRHTSGSVNVFPLLQYVVCHTTPNFGYTGCCLFYGIICMQNLMILSCWRSWNVWVSCYFTCSTYVFSWILSGW